MFCNKCGTQLPDDSIFCSRCGAKLPVLDGVPAPAPAPAKRKPAAPKKPAWPPENAVVIPREIAESDDGYERVKWLRKHNKNGVFAFEQGTEVIKACIINAETDEGFDDSDEEISDSEIIKKIYIPDTVTEIGKCAFECCESLTSINIPNSVTKIGEYAFCNCKSLTSVIIPNSVTKLGNYAFNRCESLSINIPASITEVLDEYGYPCGMAFSGVPNVTLSDGITKIFHGMLGCSAITSITIPDSVTEIEGNAFNGCLNLTTITIPHSVTILSTEAFNSCNKLETVYMPKGCKINNYGPDDEGVEWDWFSDGGKGHFINCWQAKVIPY